MSNMLRSLTLRAFRASEPQANEVNVVERVKDPIVQELIIWNTELEEQLQKAKNEVTLLSQQMIALTGKQILLQDQKNQTEDRFLALQQRYIALQLEVEQLRKENRLYSLKLQFLQRQERQQRFSPTLPLNYNFIN